MKFCLGAVFFVIGAYTVSAFVAFDNGRPSCTTEEEINMSIFRDNWDPTAYWKCFALNEPAILQRCPDQMAFLDSIKDCVNWDDWKWEEPISSLDFKDQPEQITAS